MDQQKSKVSLKPLGLFGLGLIPFPHPFFSVKFLCNYRYLRGKKSGPAVIFLENQLLRGRTLPNYLAISLPFAYNGPLPFGGAKTVLLGESCDP